MKLLLLPILTILILGFSTAYAHEYYPDKDFIPNNNFIPEKNHISEAPDVITYDIISSPGPKDETRIIQSIDRAFEIWEEHNPTLNFEKVDEFPDILVYWDMKPTHFVGRAEYVTTTYKGLITIQIGDYNCNRIFVEHSSDYLTHITMHEIGHVLGLDHHRDENHLMYSPGAIDAVVNFDRLGYNIPFSLDSVLYFGEEPLRDRADILKQRMDYLTNREDTVSQRLDQLTESNTLGAVQESVKLVEERLFLVLERNHITKIYDVVQEKLECFYKNIPPTHDSISEAQYLSSSNIPTNLSVETGDGFVKLSWVKPTYVKILTPYYIEYSDDGGNTWTRSDGYSYTTTTFVTDLVNGVSYDFRVLTTYSHDFGYPSDIVSATPQANIAESSK